MDSFDEGSSINILSMCQVSSKGTNKLLETYCLNFFQVCTTTDPSDEARGQVNDCQSRKDQQDNNYAEEILQELFMRKEFSKMVSQRKTMKVRSVSPLSQTKKVRPVNHLRRISNRMFNIVVRRPVFKPTDR